MMMMMMSFLKLFNPRWCYTVEQLPRHKVLQQDTRGPGLEEIVTQILRKCYKNIKKL